MFLQGNHSLSRGLYYKVLTSTKALYKNQSIKCAESDWFVEFFFKTQHQLQHGC